MKLCHTATIIVALAWALPAVAQKTPSSRRQLRRPNSRTLFKPVCISGLHISLFETTKVAFVIERFRNRAHHALLYDRSIMLDQPA